MDMKHVSIAGTWTGIIHNYHPSTLDFMVENRPNNIYINKLWVEAFEDRIEIVPLEGKIQFGNCKIWIQGVPSPLKKLVAVR